MLKTIKSVVLNKFFNPIAIARGWRPAKSIPIEEPYLDPRFGYDDEDEIKRAVLEVRANTMTSFERLATLWQQVKYLDRYGIQGSLVECGVWKGGSAGMMALAHLSATADKPTRELNLFDSFEGLPEPQKIDGEKAAEYSSARDSGKLEAIGKCVSPLEDCQTLLEARIAYPKTLLHYHQGWFQDTLPGNAADTGPIALLRLDGDWYESTMLCLKHLYPKLVSGGIIVMDDYGHWEGCRKATDEFIAGLGEPVLLNHIDYTGRYWVKK